MTQRLKAQAIHTSDQSAAAIDSGVSQLVHCVQIARFRDLLTADVEQWRSYDRCTLEIIGGLAALGLTQSLLRLADRLEAESEQ